ncbi:rhodanese-like domain-containing protein [Salinicoccus halitifaciens]|uniref:Rhodanese-related sulfurtransferase n=1 Tax=Salinicoccus halitifaciens TaxID=1073415 RepID=A0ABV2E986_9STAP|nr:rhodanese-like domain-containing protein [Salinicoccus halitifaciens]MCD2138003.1 rhodanese-like domain-containing protein [Salinicoccus halitifaciens]
MKQISAKELEQKLAVGEDLNIIDVREDDEVAEGKIPSAKHIPLGELEERLDEIDKDKHHYVTCHAGGRSSRACGFLSHYGYDVTNMEGGMSSWEGKTE